MSLGVLLIAVFCDSLGVLLITVFLVRLIISIVSCSVLIKYDKYSLRAFGLVFM